jgi:hypothetical protein
MENHTFDIMTTLVTRNLKDIGTMLKAVFAMESFRNRGVHGVLTCKRVNHRVNAVVHRVAASLTEFATALRSTSSGITCCTGTYLLLPSLPYRHIFPLDCEYS